MKGLKIIPMFVLLIIFSFVGALFVEANHDLVEIHFFRFHTPPIKQGLVVLISMLTGMIITGLLCLVELLALFVQNKGLKKKLAQLKSQSSPSRTSIFKPTSASRAEPRDVGIKTLGDDDPSSQTGSISGL